MRIKNGFSDLSNAGIYTEYEEAIAYFLFKLHGNVCNELEIFVNCGVGYIVFFEASSGWFIMTYGSIVYHGSNIRNICQMVKITIILIVKYMRL